MSISEQMKYVKEQAKRLQKRNQHIKRKTSLNIISRNIGHRNYDDLLKKFQIDINNIINKEKESCSSRAPSKDKEYFFITMLDDYKYDYYSHWAGWDDEGYELRAASEVNPDFFVKLVRESLLESLFVIHSETEMWKWMYNWKGRALVDASIANQYMRRLSIATRSYSHPKRIRRDSEY